MFFFLSMIFRVPFYERKQFGIRFQLTYNYHTMYRISKLKRQTHTDRLTEKDRHEGATDKQTGRQGRQTRRRTDQTNRQADKTDTKRQTGRQRKTHKHTSRQTTTERHGGVTDRQPSSQRKTDTQRQTNNQGS